MVKVYVDYGSGSDLIATFADEKTYMSCVKALEMFIHREYGNNTILSEVVTEEILTDN